MIKDKLSLLPLLPGCYLMKDKNGDVIYVGKAKKLKNRVSSYFVGAHNYKTTKLVQEIVDFDYIHKCWNFVSHCSSLRTVWKHAKDYVNSLEDKNAKA